MITDDERQTYRELVKLLNLPEGYKLNITLERGMLTCEVYNKETGIGVSQSYFEDYLLNYNGNVACLIIDDLKRKLDIELKPINLEKYKILVTMNKGIVTLTFLTLEGTSIGSFQKTIEELKVYQNVAQIVERYARQFIHAYERALNA